MATVKKGICELCGFADDSFRVEENGTILKVCKFCHDGYLERMGLPADADVPVSDVTLTLDLDGADDIPAGESGGEELTMKVEPLTEEELSAVLRGGEEDRRVLSALQRRVRRREKASGGGAAADAANKAADGEESGYSDGESERIPENESLFSGQDKERGTSGKTVSAGAARTETKIETTKNGEEKVMAVKKEKRNVKTDVLSAANPKIDDERISITSPEVPLERDDRPKTNLDVAISEYKSSIKFIDSFKYVLNKIVYAVFLGVVTLAVSVVLAIVKGWQPALIAFGGGAATIALSYLLMWYLSSRLELDRRTYLLRIRQQEILFKSADTDCYRELRTKFTVLKALGWLLSKLSVLLPLITVVGGVAASVIFCFLSQYWLFPIVALCAVIAGILVYWLVKFCADLIMYKLDAERNQQIAQQTLLDILAQLKK